MKQLSKTRTALLLAFLVIMWGVNWYSLSKAALAYSPPLLFAGIRTLIGGLLLVIVALPRIHKLRLKETWYDLSCFCSFKYYVILRYLQTIGLNYLPVLTCFLQSSSSSLF
nr:EamA family transporter [Bacillus subtilis]